jgi:hypothetical protein
MTPTLCWRLTSSAMPLMASASPNPLSTMFAPERANACAIPSPIPLVDPVTIAVLPRSIEVSTFA